MARKQNDRDTVRRYLLGQVTDAEREEIELLLLSDDEFLEEVEIVEDELIDDYLRRDLSRADREHFQKYFLASPKRRQQLAAGKALGRYLAKTARVVPRPRSFSWFRNWIPQLSFGSPIAVAVTLVIVAGLGFAIWRGFFYQSDVDKALVALNNAYQQQRPLESRITRLQYAPVVSTRGPGVNATDLNELNRAQALLLQQLHDKPTPAVHHGLGRVFLATKEFDRAIEQLQEALKGNPNDAQVYADLGAAYLEKGKAEIDKAGSQGNGDRGNGLEDLGRALENLTRALEINPNLLEALFNRALCRQRMTLYAPAEEDWRQYLQKDPNSPWAEEARKNLEIIEDRKGKSSSTREELLQNFLSAYERQDEEAAWQVLSKSREALSGKLIWDQLLDQYLNASKAGHVAESARLLDAIGYVGQLESRKSGDEFVPSLVRYYRGTSKPQQENLLEARQLIKRGSEYYFQHKLADAANSYAKAQSIFAAVSDEPESRYALHWMAYCDLERGRTHESIASLGNLADVCRRDSQQWLLMRTLYFLSSANHNLNEYSKAIAYNREALSLAERINDAIGIFNSADVLVFQYTTTGNRKEALTYADRSLSIAADCPLNEIQLVRHFTIIALAFDAAEFYYAAVDYQKEALRHTLATGHLQNLCASYARLGLMYGQLTRTPEAIRNLELATETANRDPDEAQRKQMLALSALQAGHFYRDQGNFRKALANYDQSLELSDNLNFKYSVYEAHKNRLFCYLALQDDSAAATELKTTLELAEKYRSKIIEGVNRVDFFDIEQSVYDLAMDFTYSRMHDSRQAFQFSEDSRARSLLDSVAGLSEVSESDTDVRFKSIAQPLRLDEIQNRMTADAQIMQYAVLRDKVLIWVISKEKFSAVETNISAKALEQKVTNYVDAVDKPSDKEDNLRADAKELGDLLITPAQLLLDPTKTIYIVPDKFLGSLPFGTLIASASGKFLLEDYRLEVTPSSTLMVFLSDLADSKNQSRDEHLLSVGNPSFDTKAFPSLQDLPAAAREAEQVALFYGSRNVFTGAQATYDKISTEMAKSEVIHLALHSITEQSPLQSKLVLARDTDAAVDSAKLNGSLPAYEIYKLKLPRTKLAVLSACQTGSGRYYGGEGMVSLAQPFLSAGVPLVVVSLWAVDSEATTELMINFHRHRKQDNVSSSEALRRAQLDLLNRSDGRFRQPFSWGAFVLIGGVANF